MSETAGATPLGQTVEMARYDDGPVSIHYDVEGDGFPVLLIAPGGMRSANELWNGMPWNPRTALAGEYRVIGMDQRNAGRSTGPVSADDGWATYTGDQLALLDHLGIERCHVVGMCIGGPYIMGLLTTAPERFASAVALQPVGIDDNRQAMYEMFDQWVGLVGDAHPDMTPDDWASFRSNMWDGEFVLTATAGTGVRPARPRCWSRWATTSTTRSPCRGAWPNVVPNATLVEDWKEGQALEADRRHDPAVPGRAHSVTSRSTRRRSVRAGRMIAAVLVIGGASACSGGDDTSSSTTTTLSTTTVPIVEVLAVPLTESYFAALAQLPALDQEVSAAAVPGSDAAIFAQHQEVARRLLGLHICEDCRACPGWFPGL